MKISSRVEFGGKLTKSGKIITLFLSGGFLYGFLEVLWRGFTHPSMVFAGGVGLLSICKINRALAKKNFFVRCACSAAAVTGIEFISGCIVNILFKLGVWDYSDMRFNLLGQICLLYSFFWFLLCIPVLYLKAKITPKDSNTLKYTDI